MATIKELSSALRNLSQNQENTDKRIELAFEMLDLYRTLKKPTKSDLIHCCYAAVILSGIVKKGLGSRTVTFLNNYENKLPERASTLLRSAIMRMETF